MKLNSDAWLHALQQEIWAIFLFLVKNFQFLTKNKKYIFSEFYTASPRY